MFSREELDEAFEDAAKRTEIKLDDKSFDQFSKDLDANPLSENKAAQELLARPSPWK